MLGFFDSGLGGITVVRRVREMLPAHDLVFFADQAHVPYGDRQVPALLRLVEHNVQLLDAMDADAIIAACNTSCALSSTYGWPPARAEILDLIESAAIAVQRTGCTRIAVLATPPTARSGAYAKHLTARIPGARVVEIGAPALVPIVEAGKFDSEEARDAVFFACSQIGAPVDAVVLGCTHYPLLMRHFAEFFGGSATIVDPAIVQAERTVDLVRRRGIAPGAGTLRCLTNGDARAFEASMRLLLEGIPHATDSIIACPGSNSTLSR